MFDRLVEQRIIDAIEAGAFDDLPGTGKPLVLDGDLTIPIELRMAHKVMKNAGVVPEEITLRAAIGAARQRLSEARTLDAQRDAGAALATLLTRLEVRACGPVRD